MNQHFVPKIYLNNFGKKDKNSYVVDVYDKKTDKFFTQSTKNICAEKHLYTLDDKSDVAKDKFAIENFYSQFVEPMYSRAYKILTNPQITRISPYQHAEVLLGIFQLYMRNPKWIHETISKHKEAISDLLQKAEKLNQSKIVYLDVEFNLEEYSKEKIFDYVREKVMRIFKEKHIVGTKEICEFHAQAKLEVRQIIDDSELITSDNPLVTHDSLTKDEHPLLKSKEFLIPLNSKFALHLYHDNRKHLYEIYRNKVPNGESIDMNSAIFEKAARFIIGQKSGIEKWFKLQNDYDNILKSFDKRIDIYQQLRKVANQDPNGKKAVEIIDYYLKIYNKTGKMSPDLEEEMKGKLFVEFSAWKKGTLK